MHPMHITCKSTMSKDGMTVEFTTWQVRDTAGAKVHWMMSGMAQGDMDFTDAVAPGRWPRRLHDEELRRSHVGRRDARLGALHG